MPWLYRETIIGQNPERKESLLYAIRWNGDMHEVVRLIGHELPFHNETDDSLDIDGQICERGNWIVREGETILTMTTDELKATYPEEDFGMYEYFQEISQGIDPTDLDQLEYLQEMATGFLEDFNSHK